jgi:hypothetical protein
MVNEKKASQVEMLVFWGAAIALCLAAWIALGLVIAHR